MTTLELIRLNKKHSLGLCYLAAPFSHRSRFVQDFRFKEITRLAGDLILGGVMVFSPVTHFYPMVKHGPLPRSGRREFWSMLNEYFIRRTETLLVYQLPGWAESRGVAQEMEFSGKMGCRRVMIVPGRLSGWPPVGLLKGC
jgi:hypothetical protein